MILIVGTAEGVFFLDDALVPVLIASARSFVFAFGEFLRGELFVFVIRRLLGAAPWLGMIGGALAVLGYQYALTIRFGSGFP